MDNFNISKYFKKQYLTEAIDDESAEYYFDYLTKLRDSGVTNMFGAGSYLQAEFGLDKLTARQILAKCMRSFDEPKDEIDRDRIFMKGKVDEDTNLNEFVGKELEDRNNPLYDKLVAGQGKSETVEGEILRAINRVAYRYYNDGDKYFEGYGTETAGPAHSFLVNANHPLKSAMSSIFDEPSGDSSYERMLKDALGIILDYIESKQGKYTPNNVGDIFDYEPEFEDNEDDYDDDPWGYNDEEDDDYYNEVKGNKCACKKQTKCKCSVTIKA